MKNGNKSETQNIIFGRNPVKEALRANRVSKVFVSGAFSDKEINLLFEEKKPYIKVVSSGELDSKSSGGIHQGIVAEIKPYEYSDFDEILRRSRKVEIPIIVILDGINDTHNLGAILRSCDVFNVTGVLIPKHNQVPLNATVAKSSAGAINYVPVAQIGSINQTIQRLKDNGFWIVSTDGSATIDYSKLTYDFPVALVIGSEGKGVSQLVIKNSDYVVKIPQYGHVNSLNASVAAGILLSRIRS
ncbi:MAG: 23S rRNA (guanosine(2251)-2'-O)-methyltransferase RlmB [Bacilli bacterium]|nr:23S rRNA (guanosine(2251)-2'-O)-methyltransferase RlmB [Bacilli bacterium]